jgi:putative aldouronate transport system permease protein
MFSDFGLFYQVPMNAGALYSTTQTIDTYVYRGLMQLGNIGMSSAAGVYQSVIGFVLVLTANYLVKKVSPDDALF